MYVPYNYIYVCAPPHVQTSILTNCVGFAFNFKQQLISDSIKQLDKQFRKYITAPHNMQPHVASWWLTIVILVFVMYAINAYV